MPSGHGQYALKTPAPEAADALAAENMLRREATVMRAVSQAHVLPLLDGQFRSPPYYLLTPFLEGATLGDVLAAGLRVPVRHALWIARQTAQALDALHTAGWVHGDLKPANIHVAPSGHVTLLDLAMARRVDARAADRPVAFAGTLTYAAPEQLQTGQAVKTRSDIYSLGVVLYQLLAGHPPFTGPNAASLADAHLHTPPPPLQLPDCPTAVDIRQLVARMLAKEPLRRPSSARDLAARLSRLEVAALARR